MSLIFLDIETDGLDPLTCGLVTLQLMTSTGKTMVIKDPDTLKPLKPKLEKSLIVGQNLKFDLKFLKHHFGICPNFIYDTYLAEVVLSGGRLVGRKGASLKDLVFKYCGVSLDKSEQLSFTRGVDLTKEQEQYCIDDLRYLPAIMKQQQAKIKLLGLETVVDIEMKCLPAVVWMELSGIHVDLNRLQEIEAKVQQRFKEAEAFLQTQLRTQDKQQMLDGCFVTNNLNLSSPKQLQQALNAKGYNIEKTDKTTRAKYCNDPIFTALNEYKEAETLLKLCVKPMPAFINPVTGRVHADFWQYGSKAGRFTCTKPNLQQQPSRFQEWREVFTAEPGNKLVIADYSQIELRIIGQIARDKKYIETYKAGRDLHKQTAAAFFKIPETEVTKEQRATAKSVNFGLNYGMGKTLLKSKLKMDTGQDHTEEQAAKFIRDFRALYPEVTQYLQRISQEGLQKLEVRTLTGRLCRFDPPSHETEDKYNKEKSHIERESKNIPIQGLNADMLKIAMANIHSTVDPDRVKLVNCVHDELVFECEEEQADTIATIVKKEMESAGNIFLKDIPCIVDVTIADNWQKR